MPARIKSKGWKALQKNIRALPRIVRDSQVKSQARKHAEGHKKTLVNGLKDGSLVKKQSAMTKKIRRATGRSGEALYGQRSMIRGLKIRQTRDGYLMGPIGKHKSGMSQKAMWGLHENGARIKITPKMRLAFVRLLGALGLLGDSRPRSKKRIIRIPARQPMLRSLNNYLRGEARKQVDRETRKLVTAKIKRLR